MQSKALSQSEITKRMHDIPGWNLIGKSITRDFKFRDFHETMRFVNQVADAANRADHHPNIWISYNKVKIELSTHSAGGLTVKDFGLAQEITKISKKGTGEEHHAA